MNQTISKTEKGCIEVVSNILQRPVTHLEQKDHQTTSNKSKAEVAVQLGDKCKPVA